MANRSARTGACHETAASTTAPHRQDCAARRRPGRPGRITDRPRARPRHNHCGRPRRGPGPDHVPARVRLHLPRHQLQRPALRQTRRRRVGAAPARLHPQQGQLHHQQQQSHRTRLPERTTTSAGTSASDARAVPSATCVPTSSTTPLTACATTTPPAAPRDRLERVHPTPGRPPVGPRTRACVESGCSGAVPCRAGLRSARAMLTGVGPHQGTLKCGRCGSARDVHALCADDRQQP